MNKKKSENNSAIDKHIGQRIREKRLSLGLSLKEVGNKLDVSYQQVSKYESGEDKISASRIYQMTKVISVPVSYFFEGIEIEKSNSLKEKSKSKIQKVNLNIDDLLMLQDYSTISDERLKKKIKDIVKYASKDKSRQ